MTSLLTSCYPDIFSGTAIHSGMSYGLAHSWQSALLIAAAGPHVRRTPRRENCAPSDFQGKVFLIHGSRDQIMNPQHYSLLKKDFLEPYSHTKKTVIDPKKYQYPYILENFYDDDHQLKGMGVFVIGMNHEWSGGKPRLPVAPRGPNVTPMIVHFFLNEQ